MNDLLSLIYRERKLRIQNFEFRKKQTSTQHRNKSNSKIYMKRDEGNLEGEKIHQEARKCYLFSLHKRTKKLKNFIQ
jgi:hypothetical protein